MAALFAATYPERTDGLVLYAPFAHMVRSDDVPWALSLEERHRMMEGMVEGWGTGARLEALAPSRAGDPRMRAWFARLERLSASPGSVRAQMDVLTRTDVRQVFGSIRVPTLVMHRRDDPVIDVRQRTTSPSASRRALRRAAGARHAPLGRRHGRHARRGRGVPHRRPPRARARPRAGHRPVHRHRRLHQPRRRARRRALAGAARAPRPSSSAASWAASAAARSRRPATGSWPPSTGRRARSAARPRFATRSRRSGSRCAPGCTPARSRCWATTSAAWPSTSARASGAPRAPGEVLVSSTVKDLVVGSGLEFADRGAHELKGVPGRVAAVRGRRLSRIRPARRPGRPRPGSR